MNELLHLAATNFLSPMVLFFALGFGAALLKSDLSIPEAVAKSLALYLMIAIGFKGGVNVRGSEFEVTLVGTIIAGLALSFAIPYLAFALLRATTKLGPADAAALAAHYGSISVVTFVTAVELLDARHIRFEGFLVAVMALMETPAIISGLLLARKHRVDAPDARQGGGLSRSLFREIFLNGSVVLLIGSFLIGIITGEKGMETMHPFIVDPFKGILCVFLLDMGLIAARRLSGTRVLSLPLIAFGVYMPLIGALLGLGAASLIGLSLGGTVLMMVLCASASYIAVPAAMRLAVPHANPAVYITMALAVTFPFNIIVGIPLYLLLARLVTGAP
jgi:hypothetical protein